LAFTLDWSVSAKGKDEPLNKLDQFLPGRYQQHAEHDIILRQESNGGNEYMIH
jgi:hypothetical protein